jgi:hypothetical protein
MGRLAADEFQHSRTAKPCAPTALARAGRKSSLIPKAGESRTGGFNFLMKDFIIVLKVRVSHWNALHALASVSLFVRAPSEKIAGEIMLDQIRQQGFEVVDVGMCGEITLRLDAAGLTIDHHLAREGFFLNMEAANVGMEFGSN